MTSQMYQCSSVGLVGQESWASWTMPTMTKPNGLPQCFVSSRSKIIRFIFKYSVVNTNHWMFKIIVIK